MPWHGELPTCEQHLAGRCPRSDVKFLAEHGSIQAAMYWTFQCKTCKVMFYKLNPEFVQAARTRNMDMSFGRLINDRFKGYGK